jgi:hypothetical protein
MEHRPITYLYYESDQYKAIVILVHMAAWDATIWERGGPKNGRYFFFQILCQEHFFMYIYFVLSAL